MVCKPQHGTFTVFFPQQTVTVLGEDKVILIFTLITWQELLMLCVFGSVLFLSFQLQNAFQIPTCAPSEAGTKHKPFICFLIFQIFDAPLLSYLVNNDDLNRRYFCFVSLQRAEEIKASAPHLLTHRRTNYLHEFRPFSCF